MATREESIAKYVEEFRKQYKALAESAEVQVCHTETEGWLSLVRLFRDANRQNCDTLAEELRKAAQLINERGPSEGVIKSIGDVKKQADEVYQTNRHFELSVIAPIRQPALQCQKHIASALHDAEKLDQEMPLVWGGLQDAMIQAVNDQIHYAWSEETWVVKRVIPSDEETE